MGLCAQTPAFGAPATPSLKARVDAAVHAVLTRTGVPSASIALVRNSEILYAHAYGMAQLSPQRAATPAMRYAVGSISKEFTAAALLLLQESHKVSLDDAAGRWIPGLGPAAGVSLRSLLSHTSGIRDFWPQDYDPPDMLRPVDPQQILAQWANQPLDFAAGTAWQYSNTGYTVAGLIAERAAGKPLFDFLRERIFAPLKMASVVDFDAAPLPAGDAVGYMRYALGPLRPAAKEGRGWLFGAGELAMTASDLARWDIAVIRRRVLDDASFRALTTEVRLANGAGTGYGLGIDVRLESGRRMLSHGGEVGGFTAENHIYPDDGMAIVVFTNEDATDASSIIADALAEVLFVDDSATDAATTAGAKDIFEELRSGTVDRERLTANASSYFTTQALEDFRASLGPLGALASFTLKRSGQRGGFATHVYEAAFAHQTLDIIVRSTALGLVEQYTVSAK
jgi:D-alanyl-D-alanine carboxypeptidase